MSKLQKRLLIALHSRMREQEDKLNARYSQVNLVSANKSLAMLKKARVM